MGARENQNALGAALAVLLVVLPTAGYLLSQPQNIVTMSWMTVLGIVVVLAAGVAITRAGEADAEISRLKGLLTERDRSIEDLNEALREDERIVGLLSAQNASVKGELALASFHRTDGLTVSQN